MTAININNRFEFSPVFAGAFVAIAISIVLLQFGAAIGLSKENTLSDDASLLTWNVVAVGIWILWVQLISSLAGGYVAGYVHAPNHDYTPHEAEVSDGLYGLSAWALSTVIVFAGISMFVFASGLLEVLDTPDSQVPPAEITDAEQNSMIVYAFITGATSLLAAVASWWAATMAGDHRVKNIDFSAHISFRK